MIPTKTIEELIIKHSTLEKDLSSGSLDNKVFAEKSKEYSDVNEIILNAKKYLSFENEKQELEKILEDNSSDKELKNILISYYCSLIVESVSAMQKSCFPMHFCHCICPSRMFYIFNT